MAVYKPTYCKPFSTTLDARVAINQDINERPAHYFSCKIDSSNKNITGYQIRILDEENNQIFPCAGDPNYISPITELQTLPDYEPKGTNSGINGTELRIPFFQNANNPLLKSSNALYYIVKYEADYIITDDIIKKKFFQKELTDVNRQGHEEFKHWANDIDHWHFSSDNGVLYLEYDRNLTTEETQNILLDGEPIQPEDTILIVSSKPQDINKCGLWKGINVRNSNDTLSPIKLQKVTNFNMGDMCVVTKGSHSHNTTWKYMSSQGNDQFRRIYDHGVDVRSFWESLSGHACPEMSIHDRKLKWEVILYQGNYEEKQSSTGAINISYNNLSNEWMDMTVASGNVLGSTLDRIQIASDEILTENNEYIEKIPNIANDILVLQGTYMSAFNSSSNDYFENIRAYVQYYDATLGHVYPFKDTLTNEFLKDATHCRFYKHSNDPKAILNTDIIHNALGIDIGISFAVVKNEAEPWIFCSSESEKAWSSSSVIDRRLVVPDLSTYGVRSGDLILLCGQRAPRQNGIYEYYSLSTVAADSTPENPKNEIKFCIKRPATFSNWASYIGRIFYVENGRDKQGKPWGGFNLESLASAGAYYLWNPLEVNSGSSSLLFGPERPILLFNDSFTRNHTVSLFDSRNNYASRFTGTNLIDGQDVQVGNTILFKDGKIASIIKVDAGAMVYSLGEPFETLKNNDHFYVEMGESYARSAFKWQFGQDAWTLDDSLFTARILKNTETRTYISPSTNVQENMRLKLSNNREVKINGEWTPWIPINKINTELNYIEHPRLEEPLKSYDPLDKNYPWHYEIRSFFKKSNENPFIVYEEPYVLLFKDNDPYSPLNRTTGQQIFMVRNPNIENIDFSIFSHNLGITQEGTQNYEDFYVSLYELQTAITGRSVHLQAQYKQFQEASWESYRWVLLDSIEKENGKFYPHEVVQDTGYQYDREISVTFYGLSNDLINHRNNKYYVMLYLRDSYGNNLVYALSFWVAQGLPNYLLEGKGDFTATADCKTQSVVVSYINPSEQQKLSGEEERPHYSFYRREYEVYEKPHNEASALHGYYYGGKFYADSTHEELLPLKPYIIYYDHSDFAYEPHGISYQYINKEFVEIPMYKVFKGEWEPVLVDTDKTEFRDYNIKNHRSYQYIMYSSLTFKGEHGYIIQSTPQTFANFKDRVWIGFDKPGQGQFVQGDLENTSIKAGAPVVTNWNYWSISELIPETVDLDAPIVRKQYKINDEQVWIFKYNVTANSQSQNIDRPEYDTLGRFPRFGFGQRNFAKGNLSAYLGSEIVPLSRQRYLERLPLSRVAPLSTNESVEMLEQWQKFVYSKHPKLLKDPSGQSWIVQILSSGSTGESKYIGSPTTINFEWTQVDDTNHVIIYSDKIPSQDEGISLEGTLPWKSCYKNNN